MKFQLLEGNQGAKLWIDNEYEKDGIYFADVHMKLAEKTCPKNLLQEQRCLALTAIPLGVPVLTNQETSAPNGK